MKNVDVFLFSEMNEDEIIVPVRYTLTLEEVEYLYNCRENGVAILPFGEWSHHSDDIVKFRVSDTDEQQYKNF